MRAGASIIDMGAATYGVIAALAVLRQRETTGRGQYITAGLFETSVYWVGQWMAISQLSGEPSRPMSEISQGPRMGWGVYQLFSTADDDQIFIGITSNAHWDRFCAALDLPLLHADPRFRDNAARVAARDALIPQVADAVGRLESADVQARLEAAKVPFAPMRRPDQLHDEPHLTASQQLLATRLPTGATAQLPKLPVVADGFDMRLRLQPPVLGADTGAVMRDLGYSSAEIDAMNTRRAILSAKD